MKGKKVQAARAMCYSAQVIAAYQKYVLHWGAAISLYEFSLLYGYRASHPQVRIPKAMDAAFAHPRSAEEKAIRAMIDTFDAKQVAALEQDIFRQRKRLADAERSLQLKSTKKALEDRRIARAKVEWALGKLADIKRSEPKDQDSRIFPAWYAPVMIWEDGRRVLKPMRYQCRPAGKPARYDAQYPGTYNARRDNLERFWKGQFGHTHGVMVVNAFYENVSRAVAEGRELAPGEKDENLVLEFRPRPAQEMLAACLWSRWAAPGEPDLLSFAAITDEPPAEIAATGIDRCIIPIRPEHLDAWLNPDSTDLASLYAILDDRPQPYYEHRRLAA